MNLLYRYTRQLVPAAFLLAAMASCKKSFLEIKPKGIVIAEKTSDYDLLLNNTDLVVVNAGNHTVMSDELASIEPYWTGGSVNEKKLFQWQTDLYLQSDDAAETLVPGRNLYVYNKIIQEVMASTEGTELNKKAIRAEALAGRAWVNFLWVNYYGKPYNAATAATDPAFALVTRADVNAGPYKRATVQEMYDQIVSDLTTAIPDMGSAGVYHRIRMSRCAAQGLLAKVYMFMGKFDLALPLLNDAVTNLGLSTANTLVIDYNTAYPGSQVAPNDMENIYARQYSNLYTYNTNKFVWLTPETAALYGPTDVRWKNWFDSVTLTNGATSTKFFKRKAFLTTFYGLRTPELYLLRAEVRARLNDLDGAVADLQYLRQRRMPVADAAVPAAAKADKLSLVKFVLDERLREFCMQGYRWFDMRRLSVDPLFANAPPFQHRVYETTGELKQTFTLKAPENFIFQVSPKMLAENPDMAL